MVIITIQSLFFFLQHDNLFSIPTNLIRTLSISYKLSMAWAGALVEWLWEETHMMKVVGSNPSAIYWMDIFHINLL